MPKPIELVARADFDYRGQSYRAGEEFALPAVEAIILLNRRVAAFRRRTPDTPEADPPKRTRRYRRRDLTAEDGT